MIQKNSEGQIIVKGRMTKAEFEKLYGLSPTARKRMLNHDLYEHIKPLGYLKDSWHLPIPVVKKLVELLGPPELKIEL
jgi:nickel-dependent lactate racemase